MPYITYYGHCIKPDRLCHGTSTFDLCEGTTAMTDGIGLASKRARISAGQPITAPSSVLPDPPQTLLPGYIHLRIAKEIAPILRNFGIDPDPVIQEVGLDPRLFDDGANVIPHAALGRLLTLSVARTNCPHFGLLVG